MPSNLFVITIKKYLSSTQIYFKNQQSWDSLKPQPALMKKFSLGQVIKKVV